MRFAKGFFSSFQYGSEDSATTASGMRLIANGTFVISRITP
jgi:hypothetical protein